MNLSFRARLTLRWMIGFGLVLVLALVAVYAGVRAFLIRDLDAQLRTLAGTELASSVDEPEQGVHLHEFPVGSSEAEYAGKFVQLIGDNGQVLLQSPGLGRTPALVTGQAFVEGFAGRAPVFDVSVNGRGGRMIALATAGPTKYLVSVGLYTDKLDATLRAMRMLLAGVGLASLLLTAVLGMTLASRALAPVGRITTQAAAIANGEFAARLDEPAVDDEIGRMTRLLNEMLDRLRSALDANRHFAADASHELRGPLTAMLGEIDVTLKRERSAGEYREALTLLRSQITELGALTEDLMLLVRGQEGCTTAVGEVNVRDVLAAVATRHAGMASNADIHIRVDCPATLTAYAEPRLLERVFDNLVRNAVQHSPHGQDVVLSGHVVKTDPQAGWVADDVVVAVRDAGPGIPAEERSRVFDRFYRLDPSRSRRTGGAGLGLSISREIVRLFKGSIRVADTAGPGTTIEVRLPGGVPT
jgi:two-component system OmpR family sensor kinase